MMKNKKRALVDFEMFMEFYEESIVAGIIKTEFLSTEQKDILCDNIQKELDKKHKFQVVVYEEE